MRLPAGQSATQAARRISNPAEYAMSPCPTFSNLTFSRMPVKLSCILLPLLLTYPCAFDSLVREQLVELLPQKWARWCTACPGVLDLVEVKRKLHDPIGRIPAALPFFTGVTKEDACSALLQLRDLTAHLYHRRDASDLFPSNVSSFHDIYIQFLRKRNHSALTSRSPRDSCSEPFRQYVSVAPSQRHTFNKPRTPTGSI